MDGYLESQRPVNSFLYLFECTKQDKLGCGVMAHAHFHAYYEVLYCQGGECELRLGEQIYRFAAGDMVLIDPMEVHHITALSRGSNQYIVVKFLPELLYFAQQPTHEVQYLLAYRRSRQTHQKIFPKDLLAGTEIPDVLQTLQREAAERQYGFEMAVRGAICRLFVWLLRNWRERINAQPMGLSPPKLHCLEEALSYIDTHFTESITMADVAQHCNMSYTAFSRFFSQGMQKSFPEYLTQIRLQQAYLLLATTELSITDIAMDTGFSGTSYFIQAFRKACGITPLHYRQRFA